MSLNIIKNNYSDIREKVRRRAPIMLIRTKFKEGPLWFMWVDAKGKTITKARPYDVAKLDEALKRMIPRDEWRIVVGNRFALKQYFNLADSDFVGETFAKEHPRTLELYLQVVSGVERDLEEPEERIFSEPSDPRCEDIPRPNPTL